MPDPGREAKWTARAHVWGAIGVGVKQLLVFLWFRQSDVGVVETLKTFLRTDKMKGKGFTQDGAPVARHRVAQLQTLQNAA